MRSSQSKKINQSEQDNTGSADLERFGITDNRASTVIQKQEKENIQNSPKAVLQRQTFESSLEKGTSSPNHTGMPDSLKNGLEHLSGFDLSDVRVHYNSNKPSRVGALAYAQGNQIHLGPGQEKHLPHEGWHVVQQKQGRVKPTLALTSNIFINDSSSLEKEAEVQGRVAAQSTLQKKSAQSELSSITHSSSSPIQCYPGFPKAKIKAWSAAHLKKDSDLSKALTWLKAQDERPTKEKKLEWEKQFTEKAYKKNPDIANTGKTSDLSQFRAQYQVPKLTQSKYKIVKNEKVNLPGGAPEDVDKEKGFIVSSPLYAGLQNFPTQYLNGQPDIADHCSFLLAYNAHGLLAGDTPVEDAVARNELRNTRGVSLGFYWEQQLEKVDGGEKVWTDNTTFKANFNRHANTPEKKKAFVGSLRHEKVLGTFPYGMWRTIALNKTSVNCIMDSRWGKGHKPIYTHITDPDSETWIDPFSRKHVALQMTEEAAEQDDTIDIIKGSYNYSKTAKEGDSDWDKQIKIIAHASSQLDALLRPALNDKLEVDYPAERNLMIRLTGNGENLDLYKQDGWKEKTTLDLTLNQLNDFDGDETIFGIGDAEGRKLEKNIKSIIDGVKIIVSSAAVTTDVPPRVKASIAAERYSDHEASRGTGNLAPLSNVKESLLASETLGMMKRPQSKMLKGEKLAIEEFKDRPRSLWADINRINSKIGRTDDNIADMIESHVDHWDSVENRKTVIERDHEKVENILAKFDSFMEDEAPILLEFQDLHGSFYTYGTSEHQAPKKLYQEAVGILRPRLEQLKVAIDNRAEQAGKFHEHLKGQNHFAKKAEVLDKLDQQVKRYQKNNSYDVLQDVLKAIEAKSK